MMPNDLWRELNIRNCQPEDHADVIAVVKEWWGGRDLAYALPRLFFDHFNDTSFVVRHNDSLVAFLIGFMSPSKKKEGYIHFAGVHPEYRKMGLASHLYGLFFDCCRTHDRSIVRACTSPVNTGSIGYHTRMGFAILPGNGVLNGVAVTLDYNRPGDPKVLFQKQL
jgi:ribosomal protein S18 acetylase RimI-like enzyme